MGRLRPLPPRIGSLGNRIGAVDGSERALDAHRAATQPWRDWYKLARWADLRARVFLRDLYTCRMCGKLHASDRTLTADHVRPHRGDPALFWADGNVQALCTSPCHVKHKQAAEAAERGR